MTSRDFWLKKVEGVEDATDDKDAVNLGQSRSVAETATDVIAVSPTSTRFGAVGDGSTDDTAALDLWLQYLIDNNVPGIIPPLTFVYNGQIDLDLAAVATSGIKIFGCTTQSSIIRVVTSSSPAVRIYCSGGSVPSPVIQANSEFLSFGFRTDLNGVGLRLGTSNFTDQLNRNRFDLTVTNSNTGTSAAGVEFNAMYWCKGRINTVVNGNPATIATGSIGLHYRKCAFCSFEIGSAGSDVLQQIDTDYNYGNTFISPDLEVGNTCVKISGATSVNNTWIGGTFAHNTYGIDATGSTAGANNVFINPNLNSSAPLVRTGSVGVTINDAATAQVAAPTNGSTVTVNPRTDWLYLAHGAAIASATIDLSSIYPGDGQRITVLAENEITSVTWTPVWDGPSRLAAGDVIELRYYPPSTAWYRTSQKAPTSTVTWTTIKKTADQSTTSTTYADDNTLKFSVTSGKKYAFRGMVLAEATGGTGGFKTAINGPTLSTGELRVSGSSTTQTAYDTTFATSGATAGNFCFQFQGYFDCATTGTLSLRIAQSSASGTTTFEKGSYIEWMQIV